jgi:hypothetical protein
VKNIRRKINLLLNIRGKAYLLSNRIRDALEQEKKRDKATLMQEKKKTEPLPSSIRKKKGDAHEGDNKGDELLIDEVERNIELF